MNWLSDELNITTMDDWYNVSDEVKINCKKSNKNIKKYKKKLKNIKRI